MYGMLESAKCSVEGDRAGKGVRSVRATWCFSFGLGQPEMVTCSYLGFCEGAF